MKLKSFRMYAALIVTALTVVVAATTLATAQTLTTLYSFDYTHGSGPDTALFQATNGYLYGTTQGGGTSGAGVVFKISPGGALRTLYSFGSPDDDYNNPNALIQATDGNFYGTTYGGGTGGCSFGTGCGVIFKITPSGTPTTLYSFCSQGGNSCSDGASPDAALIQASDGNFYGTTYYGGANGWEGGTVFKISRGGTRTALYSFCPKSNCRHDGQGPQGLIQASDGNFYGIARGGGVNGVGTVFKITPGGKFMLLHSFDNSGGAYPYSTLVQASDGNFYGTTYYGGANNDGTVFKITSGGVFTTLHTFDGTDDGAYPSTALIQGTDGNLYGTTASGGANGSWCDGGCGTIFTLTTSGTFTNLYIFCPQSSCAYGETPNAPLVQDTNGTLYGTTSGGGANVYGTVFSLDMGLGPFVRFMRDSGKVGWTIGILGQGFAGATSVSFNGTPATFTLKSDRFLIATVPEGVTTGNVTVTTPSGTLTSNVKFQVRP